MADRVSKAMIAEIRRRAERKLGRTLSSQEQDAIKVPRSYMGLECILDYLNDPEMTGAQAEHYLKHLNDEYVER